MKTRSILISTLVLLFAGACTPTPFPAPSGDGNSPVKEPLDEQDSYPAPEVIVPPPGASAYPAPDDSAYPPPGDSAYPAPDATDSAYPAPEGTGEVCTPGAAEPQEHNFQSEDGPALTGTFYHSANCHAPLVLLMHQFGSSKEAWSDLALWLQNRAEETTFSSGGILASPAVQYTWFPPMPEGLSMAVFAFDFRGHGESGDGNGFDPQGFLMDAQAALAYAKTLPNVDPERIIMIGASIGADASVDACLLLSGAQIADIQENQGCIGAMPLSPGSFLDVSYSDVIARLGDEPFDINIHCVATERDGAAPDLCSLDMPGRYRGTVYPDRGEHGTAMIMPGLSPDIGQLILDFLLESLGSGG